MPIRILYDIKSVVNEYEIISYKSGPSELLWTVKCTQCGKITTKRGSYLRSSKKCVCHRKQHPETDFKQILTRYQSNAITRSLSFDLTFDQLKTLVLQNCHYCGAAPNMTISRNYKQGLLKFNGIDRKINSIGYTIDNCVPCCKRCNISKYNMDYNEFLEWIKTIYEHRATR